MSDSFKYAACFHRFFSLVGAIVFWHLEDRAKRIRKVHRASLCHFGEGRKIILKKRAVSLFMALIMAFTMAAGTVSPAAAEEAGSYTASLASDAYNVSVNGTIQILFSKAMDDESASEPITLTNSERKSEVCSCTWNDEGTCLKYYFGRLGAFYRSTRWH